MILYFLQDIPTFFNQVVDVSTIIIALCSLLVSGLAVYFTYKGLKYSREHNKKSVLPFLQIKTHINTIDPEIDIFIINNGLGVAIIDKFILSKNNQVIDACDQHELNNLYQEIEEIRGNFNTICKDDTIPPDTKRTVLKINGDNYNYLKNALGDIEIKCVFKSIYADRYEVDYHTDLI